MRDSESAPTLSTADIGRALHAIPASSAIPTLADNDFIRDAQQQENASERQARRECERAAARPSAGQSAAESGTRNDHHDNDPGEASRITHPRLKPSQAQIGGPAHPAPQVPGGAAVPSLSRRGFLTAAALAPVAAPMIAASAGFAHGGVLLPSRFVAGTLGEYSSGEALPLREWTPHEVRLHDHMVNALADAQRYQTEDIGRVLHHIPRRLTGEAVHETVSHTPITPSEREARASLARSVLPFAAQVQWGIAL